MGINGLETFIEEHLSDACYLVDIPREVNNYKIKTGRNAKIVVDTLSCPQVGFPPVEFFAGYEVQRYIDQVRAFVEGFKRLDVELVFFFVGLNLEKRLQKWLQKQREDIEMVHRAIDCVAAEVPLPKDFRAPLANTRLMRTSILKYVFGCEVRTVVKDSREEIIKYAKQHECFAIFAQNAEFLASQVDARLWSSKHFLLGEMTTKEYDREQLARGLEINTNELPLLALLMAGRSVFPMEEMEKFYSRFWPNNGRKMPYKYLIPVIARYINQLSKDDNIEDTLTRLAVDMFEDTSRMQSMKTRYDSYFGATDEPIVSPAADGWPLILHVASGRFRNSILPTDAYSAMSTLTFLDHATFEDLRNGHRILTRDLSSSKFLRLLRARLYGILLWEKESTDPSVPVTVQEWSNDDENSYIEPVVVEPIKPEVHHPGLMTLWNNDDDFDEVRWTLFLATVAPSMRPSQWRSFDDGFMLSTLAVSHLYERKYLNEPELHAVLVTIATFPLYAKTLPPSQYEWLHGRATDISITLNRTFSLVLNVLATCGYPFKLSEDNSYLKFDGRVFQIKYHGTVHKQADIESLCDENDECFNLFKRMEKIII